jgi:hypothetical protein
MRAAAVQWRREIIHATLGLQCRILEKRSIPHIAPDIGPVVGAARQNNAIRGKKRNRAINTDLKSPVKFGEVLCVDGSDHHSRKAAVGMIEASGYRDDPDTASFADERRSDKRNALS